MPLIVTTSENIRNWFEYFIINKNSPLKELQFTLCPESIRSENKTSILTRIEQRTAPGNFA